MAQSNVPKVQEYNTLLIEDGAATPLSFPIDGWGGMFSYTDPKPDRIVIYDRRRLSAVIAGKVPITTGSFTVHARSFTDASATADNILDVINNSNTWSAAVSTAAASFSNFILKDLTFGMEGTDFADTTDHAAIFADCFLGEAFSSGQPNTFSIPFECYGGLTFTGPLAA